MRNFYVLYNALEYIENNICEKFSLNDVADSCASSLSNLHRLFRYALRYSIKEYIEKRRHSLACHDLINTDLSVLQIALRYQYNSHEVFVRAFTRLRGETPSAYRKDHSLANLYPKIKLNTEETDMRNVDISELYDSLKALKNSFVLCADIAGLMIINDRYGHPAGDIILAKTAERIEKHLADDMFLFRIGRDEFAIVSGLYNEDEVRKLSEEILEHNGETISAGVYDIPLSLRIGITKIPEEGLSYSEVLQNMQSAITEAKK